MALPAPQADGPWTLFLGADLPVAVTGLPSRADLARALARRYGLDESLPLSEAAQRVSQAGNRFAFTALLREALATGASPRPFHARIVAAVQRLHIETILTTAYDDLLARAFQQASLPCDRVVRGDDLAFLTPGRPTLIHLYGDIAQPDTLVVTDRDHLDLLRDRAREPLLDEVRRAFRRTSLLFLGYNLADPDFRFLFDQVAESRFARLAYAVWPGLPADQARAWRERGIVILDEDPLGVLEEPASLGSAALRPPGEVPVASGSQPATANARSAASEPVWNTVVVRELLAAAFSDEELTSLCFDHFRPVYDDFGVGMGKGQKIQRLLDYCVRQRQLERLLSLVADHNPAQYALYLSRLSTNQ
jgi:hypothetical protein